MARGSVEVQPQKEASNYVKLHNTYIKTPRHFLFWSFFYTCFF